MKTKPKDKPAKDQYYEKRINEARQFARDQMQKALEPVVPWSHIDEVIRKNIEALIK